MQIIRKEEIIINTKALFSIFSLTSIAISIIPITVNALDNAAEKLCTKPPLRVAPIRSEAASCSAKVAVEVEIVVKITSAVSALAQGIAGEAEMAISRAAELHKQAEIAEITARLAEIKGKSCREATAEKLASATASAEQAVELSKWTRTVLAPMMLDLSDKLKRIRMTTDIVVADIAAAKAAATKAESDSIRSAKVAKEAEIAAAQLASRAKREESLGAAVAVMIARRESLEAARYASLAIITRSDAYLVLVSEKKAEVAVAKVLSLAKKAEELVNKAVEETTIAQQASEQVLNVTQLVAYATELEEKLGLVHPNKVKETW